MTNGLNNVTITDVSVWQKRIKELTVESDVMVGEDDGSVSLGNSLHCAVDSSIRSLHVVLLQTKVDKGKHLNKIIC